MRHVNIKDVCCLNAGGGWIPRNLCLTVGMMVEVGQFFFFCMTRIKSPFEEFKRAAGPQRGRVAHRGVRGATCYLSYFLTESRRFATVTELGKLL